jgi:hypothetical protein
MTRELKKRKAVKYAESESEEEWEKWLESDEPHAPVVSTSSSKAKGKSKAKGVGDTFGAGESHISREKPSEAAKDLVGKAALTSLLSDRWKRSQEEAEEKSSSAEG